MPEDCSSCNLIANDGKCGDKDWKSQLKASQVHELCGVTEESFQWSVQLFEFLLLELLRECSHECSHSSLLKLNKGICKNFNEILQLEVFIWTSTTLFEGLGVLETSETSESIQIDYQVWFWLLAKENKYPTKTETTWGRIKVRIRAFSGDFRVRWRVRSRTHRTSSTQCDCQLARVTLTSRLQRE